MNEKLSCLCGANVIEGQNLCICCSDYVADQLERMKYAVNKMASVQKKNQMTKLIKRSARIQQIRQIHTAVISTLNEVFKIADALDTLPWQVLENHFGNSLTIRNSHKTPSLIENLRSYAL